MPWKYVHFDISAIDADIRAANGNVFSGTNFDSALSQHAINNLRKYQFMEVDGESFRRYHNLGVDNSKFPGIPPDIGEWKGAGAGEPSPAPEPEPEGGAPEPEPQLSYSTNPVTEGQEWSLTLNNFPFGQYEWRLSTNTPDLIDFVGPFPDSPFAIEAHSHTLVFKIKVDPWQESNESFHIRIITNEGVEVGRTEEISIIDAPPLPEGGAGEPSPAPEPEPEGGAPEPEPQLSYSTNPVTEGQEWSLTLNNFPFGQYEWRLSTNTPDLIDFVGPFPDSPFAIEAHSHTLVFKIKVDPWQESNESFHIRIITNEGVEVGRTEEISIIDAPPLPEGGAGEPSPAPEPEPEGGAPEPEPQLSYSTNPVTEGQEWSLTLNNFPFGQYKWWASTNDPDLIDFVGPFPDSPFAIEAHSHTLVFKIKDDQLQESNESFHIWITTNEGVGVGRTEEISIIDAPPEPEPEPELSPAPEPEAA